tara:strand:+ start:2024 stop:2794 length:771 start_codon:yes stop_codon:yes gene_type:complete
MIERQFVSQKLKEFQIQEYMASELSKAGYSHTEIQRTPLGEKVIIFTTRPGIVVGKKGDNIKRLTNLLKNKYNMENPQIEIGEVNNPMLDVQYIADRIAFSLERFGQKRFKSIGYKMLQDIMNAGAIGAEIVISGKIPSARARTWRFSAGYLKKSGDIAESFVHKYIANVGLKAGTIGIKVSIMTPDILLPDKMLTIKEESTKPIMEEVKQQEIEKPTKKQSTKTEKEAPKDITKPKEAPKDITKPKESPKETEKK